jgi:hypothetical protein
LLFPSSTDTQRNKGGAVMKTIVLATSLLATAAGCSTLPRQEIRNVTAAGIDIRGETPVHGRRSKAIVSGPVRVEHLSTSGGGVVSLYLADDPGIGDRLCPSAGAEQAAPVAVLGPGSRVTDIAVPEGQRVCATVAEAPATRVSWQALVRAQAQAAVAPDPDRAFDLALNQALLGR